MNPVNEDSDQDYPCFDISATLRAVASQVEKGEINPIRGVLVFQHVDSVHLYTLGPCMESEDTLEVLQRGVKIVETVLNQ